MSQKPRRERQKTPQRNANKPRRNALTVTYSGIASEIRSDIGVSIAYDPQSGDPFPQCHPYQAVWDTGATKTVISTKLVSDLGLSPIGDCDNYTAGNVRKANIYLVNLYLPMGVNIPGLMVIDSELHQTPQLPRYDVLIGMDIIGSGDFCITNHEGQTCMTFEMPSYRRFDFVKQINASKSR